MMARQSKIARPNAPRIAPTAIKTVPSGAVDLCMYGASEVGGTVAAGYVGMDVSAALEPLALLELLSVGMVALVLVVRPGIELVEVAVSSLLLDEVVVSLVEVVEVSDVVVVVSLLLVEVVVSDVDVVSDVVVSVALVVVVSAAMAPAENRASARTVDSSSVRCRGERDDLILGSLSGYGAGA